VKVIAHETFVDWLINDSGVIGPILGARSSLATVVPTGPEGAIHGGLGLCAGAVSSAGSGMT
jgi:hypothetical protein